jgi:hypothetical protein
MSKLWKRQLRGVCVPQISRGSLEELFEEDIHWLRDLQLLQDVLCISYIKKNGLSRGRRGTGLSSLRLGRVIVLELLHLEVSDRQREIRMVCR